MIKQTEFKMESAESNSSPIYPANPRAGEKAVTPVSYEIGYGRTARRSYSFDEVAIVPGVITLNPEEVDISTTLGPHKLKIPFLASAMDGVVDTQFAVLMSKLGGLAVLNLDGVAARYDKPEQAIAKIIKAKPENAARIVQEVYSKPIRKELIAQRIKEIKKAGGLAAVSTVPQNAKQYAPFLEKAGVDFLVIQATVVTARHGSRNTQLDLAALISSMNIAVIVGNCVTYEAAWELMETGCCGVLVGLGPGSACTSRQVLGVGVPQVTAICDVAFARDKFFSKTGRRVAVIADGGMNTGGDVCKAIACGADAVMLGSAFARAQEAPGKGFHWGMAMPSRYLPRGTRIHVGTSGTLEEILMGPATKDDGTQNLAGALRTCMGYVGAKTLLEMQKAELVIAPEIKHEGKKHQKAQKVGMG